MFVNGTQVYSNAAISAWGSGNSGNIFIGSYFGGSATSYIHKGYMSGLRYVASSLYSSNFTPPTSPVAAIANTSLLLNFTNGGIVDVSAKNALETLGTTQISSAQSKFGGKSIAFDGTAANITMPYNSNFSLGIGDFTVEGWFYFTNLSTTMRPLIQLGDGANGSGPIYNAWSLNYMGSEGSNQLRFYRYDGTEFSYATSALSLTANVWTHIAVSRSSGTLKIFVNGVSYYSNTVTQSFAAVNTNPLRIGLGYYGPQVTYGGPRYWSGYMDDIRITKGIARYTANFTPPLGPLAGR
jgi:hypothetical protein